MGIPVDPVLRAQMDRFDRVFLLSLLLADTDGLDYGNLITHTGTSITYFTAMLYIIFHGSSILSCRGRFYRSKKGSP